VDLTQQVRNAANDLIGHFGSGRIDQYFNCFSPQADFIFYTHPQRLTSRSAYQELWQQWEKEFNFKVHSCTSANQLIRIVNNIAIFTHDVTTAISNNDGKQVLYERETIIFINEGDRWIAIHEHLSPVT
jgi:ketosteroid isomerase-like protein